MTAPPSAGSPGRPGGAVGSRSGRRADRHAFGGLELLASEYSTAPPTGSRDCRLNLFTVDIA